MRGLDIIGKRKVFFLLSGVTIFLSIFALGWWGLRPGIDFVGGTLWEFRFGDDQEKSAVEHILSTKVQGEVILNKSTDGVFVVRMRELPESEHQELIKALKELNENFEELRWETVGPTVGESLRRKSFLASALVLLGISLYVAFVFRKVSRPVSSFKYGLVTVFTLFHDVIIPLGVFSVLSRFYGVEIDTNFVVAMLVIMGFSVHDTIVVFDRIREKLRTSRNSNFDQVVNESLNETLARSLYTSLTLLFVLIAILIWGGTVLRYFILAMIIGVIVGTYSSIAFGSMLLVEIWKLQQKIRKKMR